MQLRRPPLPLALVAIAVALVLTHGDEVQARANAALGEGMPLREAALARGFVLGEDAEIDSATKEDFRRAGLSHLLAVSGQNVALLALLAMPVLAALRMPLRTRLVWVLGLIAVYVPLAGAGPSIQRAGVMGALSVLATLAGRRASRFYALLAAAAVMLLLEPGIAADIGWQLSFAAVLGILLLAAPIRVWLAGTSGGRRRRRALADAAAMTIAATVATAPLIAFHFEELSTLTLLANLMALPAVAPAMWLGMLSAAAGQASFLPLVHAINAVNVLLLAYVAQVAAWCGRPSWACPHVHLGPAGLVASYVAIAAIALLASRLRRRMRLARRRRASDGPRTRPIVSFSAHRRRAWLALALAALALAVGFLSQLEGAEAGRPRDGLRISVLDVGQGDAILLQPGEAPPVLVDGGPPGDGLAAMLHDAGVDGLGAVIVTHDQSDHAGGVRELLGTTPVGELLYGVLGRSTLAQAGADAVPTARLARGAELRSGPLRLDVLWPPAELLAGAHQGEDPNLLAIVLVARWHRFSMLLTADAEAEATPLDPGPVDVLKVAHHGSEDAGLAALLDRTRPRFAVISVGAGNPFGHPTPATLATLAEHGVRTLRTDLDGTVAIDVEQGSIRVSGDR